MARAASLFNQLLQQFPRAEFQRLVKEKRAERSAKGFSSWSQFVSMLFCQVAWRIRCGRSATGLPVVLASSVIWA
jgi:hypothetical protein